MRQTDMKQGYMRHDQYFQLLNFKQFASVLINAIGLETNSSVEV